MSQAHFRCILVEQQDDQTVARLTTLGLERLPAAEVTVQVAYSSLNYKDALAVQGHRGVVRHFPHVPGIDAAGVVIDSKSSQIAVGQPVIVTGYDLGQGQWGGWSELIRVPASWIVPLPDGLTLRQAMAWGTAGFTAAQCVEALLRNRLTPDSGEIVVTGATGGVGSVAVQLLAKLGFRVVAVSGKPEREQFLLEMGAARVLGRQTLGDLSGRPMLSAQWAGGVDTVGGPLLNTLLRSTSYGGCVAACGLVAGAELEMTVYPFLLRGVVLAGVASADCPHDRRLEIWHRLAGEWRLPSLENFVTEVELGELLPQVEKIAAGHVTGRVIVRIGQTDS